MTDPVSPVAFLTPRGPPYFCFMSISFPPIDSVLLDGTTFLLLFHILLKLNACLEIWQVFAEFRVNKQGINGPAWIKGKLFELQEGWNLLFSLSLKCCLNSTDRHPVFQHPIVAPSSR